MRSLTVSALYLILLDSQIIGLQSCAHPILLGHCVYGLDFKICHCNAVVLLLVIAWW